MTTRVLLVNHGPDHVLVRTFTKDNHGTGMRDVHWHPHPDLVAPGTVKEFYVHSNQGLTVDEERPEPDSGFGSLPPP